MSDFKRGCWGIQRYDFSTIALEVARSLLMTIQGRPTKPILLNTDDKFRAIGVSNSVTASKNRSSGCQPSPQPLGGPAPK
ncbi:hypothetical protein QUB63_30815 [Microcoleus sp. ARI1-B5]|uniref:hypothetical protein n=1 Tax=unclassified Microcoleus TaxID=2642155 RepID=UPI002FD08B53